MPRRLVILTVALVAAVVFAGAAAAASAALNLIGDAVERAPRHFSAATARQSAKAPPAKTRGGEADTWSGRLADNKEFLLYGGIASFGILMILFAIGNASSGSKNGAQLQLQMLRQEKEKAEHLARLKAEFLNQVSHELRTPLAVILGYVECITDGLYGQLDEKHQEILQIVAKQSTHLKNMIDQILIYSRLEANKQPVRAELLELTALVTEMRDTFDFLCKQKGVEMRWDLPNDSFPIHGDAGRVKEVVSNLLQNAVKYTDRGSVTLTLSKSRAGDAVMVEVRDTGMGISQQHLTNIFEPFMQVHKTSTENSRGGIGLGLSIVKKHLEQIKGEIQVESELGKGSTFRVVLPKSFEKSRSRARRLWGILKPRFENQSTTAALPAPQLRADRSNPASTGHTLG